MDDAAVLLLAGGDARRFPCRLEQDVESEPMIVRVYRRLRASPWPLYVLGKSTFSPEIDARIEAPLLIDRRPGRGPLAALYSACATIAARWVFAVAADMPNVDLDVLDRLARARRDGDESVVAQHDGQTEPLCALYQRRAILRDGWALQRRGRSAMRDLVESVRTRFEPFEGAYFLNVNRPSDLPVKGAPA